MLYRILQSVVLLGLETLFSDNMISGKKRPGLETNINFLLLFMIFWSKSFADFWIIYFLKNISTRSSKETEHGLDFFLDSLIHSHVFFFPLNEILMEMYHHQDTKYGVKRKQPETSRHSVLYHRLKHTDNMEKIKKKHFPLPKQICYFTRRVLPFKVIVHLFGFFFLVPNGPKLPFLYSLLKHCFYY